MKGLTLKNRSNFVIEIILWVVPTIVWNNFEDSHRSRVSKVEIEIEIISKNLDLVSISNLEIWNSRSRLSKILKPHIFGKFCIEFFEFLIDFDKLSTYSSIIVNMKQISSMKTLNLYFVGSSKWFLFVIFNNGSLLIF